MVFLLLREVKCLLFPSDWVNVLAESVWLLEFRFPQHFQYGCNVFLTCCGKEEVDGETTILTVLQILC